MGNQEAKTTAKDQGQDLASPPRLDVSALFGKNRLLILDHQGCEYRLQLTSNDKLILTK